MATATAIISIAVINHYRFEGEGWLEVDMGGRDYDDLKKLPVGLLFEGECYGRTGWNSDRGVAYYSTRKKLATPLVQGK